MAEHFLYSPDYLFHSSPALSLPSAKLEAWGFEPQSRDNIRGGHYMLIRCFDLDPGNEHRHPSPGPSRLKSRPPTNGRIGEPGSHFAADVMRSLTPCRGCLN
jgi:hypothetical protein